MLRKLRRRLIAKARRAWALLILCTIGWAVCAWMEHAP